MDFATLISNLSRAAVRGDGQAARACFTPEGIYHDCFYGAFQGDAIVDLIEHYFHRDGCNFIWDIHHPIADDRLGYARYTFSYESKLPQAAGKRAGFEGVSICELREGKLVSYREVANSLVSLQVLGFAPEHIAKLAAREAAAFFARPEVAHHRG